MTISAKRTTPIVLLCFVGACASGPALQPARSPEMEENMVELRALNAGHLRAIEELQNRIFILEEKIDSQRLAAAARRPRSATVKPAAPGEMSTRIGEPASDAAPAAVYSSSWGGDNVIVEYAGEAALPAKRHRTRPVLRLSGTGRAAVALSAPEPETTTRPTRSSVRKPLALYRESLAALRAGRVAVALTGFRKFLARYPHHSYADNVQYEIGVAYLELDQFHAAVRELRHVVERYPHGNKVPDALLKIGLAQLARGERREGRLALESLCRSYPRHAATRLATERLAQGDARTPTTASLEASPRDLDAFTPSAR